MPVTITVTGETLANCYESLGIGAEEAVESLRHKMRGQGLALNVEAADELPSTINNEPEPAPPKRRGRPPKAASTNGSTAGAPLEPMPADESPPEREYSRDEVVKALNGYSDRHGGQAAGRQLMQEVCGAVKLVDVKPADYGKLVAAAQQG